ncbi:hypothetical protein, conserved [Eimeria tenella]|uniref:CFA20 domain-containing protein n=1 Tax=Eimeria tenella TaxID=5802 RepID=U6L3K8_EIMTE|nr:hypothetical protein, conserved [Eimeria tenella]CDJ42355.1 hypothetical protein, conserved [Eimeria tenella]|eukprot:XP_013233105.1 hypothetical protein, conserved [Eimeria tenella]
MTARADETRAAFINVLKEFPIGDPTRSSQHGEVTEEVVRAAILQNLIPNLRCPKIPVRLSHKNVYIQFKPMANRFFVMHFDLRTAKDLPLRITLTNIVKLPKVRARVIQYPLLPPSRWVQICVHVPSMIGQFTKLTPTGNTLVSVQICSCLYLRGLFTSDNLYTMNDIPKVLRIKDTSALRPQELLPWVYVPVGCRSPECNQISCSSTDRSTPEPLHGI